MSKKFLLALLILLGLALPAAADIFANDVYAEPVIWRIKNGRTEVTLFGSIHALPANLHWLTPEIRAALGRTSIFVFEVPTDEQARDTLEGLISTHATLPEGQSLRALLPSDSQPDYDAVVAASHMTPAIIDREQPWLASMQLTLASSMNRGLYPDAGVDYVLMDWANKYGRRVRYLETVDQQFAMLEPQNGDMRLNEFQAGLKRRLEQAGAPDQLRPYIDAWSRGDVKSIGAQIDADFAPYPDVRKRLLTDRNSNWADKIDAMMKEGGRYFVTVGAAHLTGPDGVLALLRARGYKIDGP